MRSRDVSEHARKICAPKSMLKCFNRIQVKWEELPEMEAYHRWQFTKISGSKSPFVPLGGYFLNPYL